MQIIYIDFTCMHFHISSLMSTLQSHPFSDQPPPATGGTGTGFPMLAAALLGIAATAFLLISYYIFVTDSCSRWQLRARPEDSASHSPTWRGPARGLDELTIRDIPTVQYTKQSQESESEFEFSKCVVCLNEFQEEEMLRILPKCSHAFHLDCIDIWLLNSSNCPICRSVLSGRFRHLPERIVAPNSSPTIVLSDGDSGRFLGEFKVSVMEEDEGTAQPIRRSFSMDSADIIRQRNNVEECGGSSRSMRSIFSFGGRGSRNAILPV